VRPETDVAGNLQGGEKTSAGAGEERCVAIGGTGRWDLLLVLPCKSFLAGTLGLLATPYCAASFRVRFHRHGSFSSLL
jgi:hypothetical protein